MVEGLGGGGNKDMGYIKRAVAANGELELHVPGYFT